MQVLEDNTLPSLNRALGLSCPKRTSANTNAQFGRHQQSTTFFLYHCHHPTSLPNNTDNKVPSDLMVMMPNIITMHSKLSPLSSLYWHTSIPGATSLTATWQPNDKQRIRICHLSLLISEHSKPDPPTDRGTAWPRRTTTQTPHYHDHKQCQHNGQGQPQSMTAQTTTNAPKQVRMDAHMHRSSCHHHKNHQHPLTETRCRIAVATWHPNDDTTPWWIPPIPSSSLPAR